MRRLTFEAYLAGADARVQVTGPGIGEVYLARTAAGVTEDPPGSGIYSRDLEDPLEAGTYLVVWDVAGDDPITPANSASETFTVERTSGAGPTGPSYALPADLRVELGLEPGDTAGLSDADAERRIRDAEYLVDELAGPRAVLAGLGRKYDVSDAGDLSTDARGAVLEATVLIAASMKTDPEAWRPAAGTSISGPEFSISGLRPGVLGPAAVMTIRRAAAALDRAGLRARTARAVA